ncbi:MAG TPA: hypothetical protein VLG50_08250 [Candidatus Saccharimonadales bacterium]|nr:hypothetical protein [Candidatus Saccharimonadales bacterium]
MSNQIGMMKIIYDSVKNETNKTIALLTPLLYNKLIDTGYDISRFEIDFKIKKYKFNDNITPPIDKSSNLFIPIIKKTTEWVVTNIINHKLEILAQFNIVPVRSWRIKCPINSRENGVIKLGCFIFFHHDVPVTSIGVVKFLLNNTYWDDDNKNDKYDNTIRCYWARKKL